MLSGVAPVRAQEQTLDVAVAGSPPFVIDDGADGVSGLSVDVWQALAREIGAGTNLEPVPEVSTALDRVASGAVDVAIGPISITADRAEHVRFTQPYFGSSLGILAPPSASLLDRFRPFLTRTFAAGAIGLLMILGLVGMLFWLAERQVNPEHFPRETLRGIGNGLWMALVTMTTVGYGDRVPLSTLGRFVAGGWMLVSLVIASSLTAFLATALTLSQIESGAISTADELAGRRVGVVTGTTSAAFAASRGARPVPAADLDAAIDALAAGETDAVVFDRPILRYVLGERPDLDLRLAPSAYQPQNYGFAVLDRDLADALDRAILRLHESGELARIEERWLGAG